MEILDQLFETIQKNNLEEFEKLINEIDEIEDVYLNIIKILVEKFKEVEDNGIDIYEFLEIFEKFVGNNISIFCKIILNELFNEENIKLIVRNTKLLYPYLIYTDLIKVIDDEVDITYAFNIVDKIFQNLTIKELKTLLDKSEILKSRSGVKFFSEKIRELEIKSKRPRWILDDSFDIEKISKESENTYNFENIEEEGNFVFENLSNFEAIIIEDIEETKKEFVKNYILMSEIDRKELLESAVNNKGNRNIELFKLYGPINKMIGHDIFEREECIKYGGCRMFLCNHRQKATEFDDIIDYSMDSQFEDIDWFTGFCEICNRKIEKRNHSLRIPELQGNWYGCFCSRKCALKYIDDFADNEIIGENILINESDFSNRLMRDKFIYFLSLIKQIGIYDF